MKKQLLVLLLVMLLVPLALADDFVPADEEETAADTFVIGSADTGSNIALQFGDTLTQALQWDVTNLRFNLGRDLRIFGDLELNGSSFILDADNTGAGNTVSFVAEQGTDNDGELRYNSTLNQWEISNDGGTFAAISTGPGSIGTSVFYAYDNTGAQILTATEVTLNIDTEVVSDANYALLNDEVTVTNAGLYRITLEAGFSETNTSAGARTSLEMRLQENGADIPGALTDCYLRESEENGCSLSILESLTAGAVVRARLQRTGGNTNVETLAEASRLIMEFIR